jgi:hypothetical protein
MPPKGISTAKKKRQYKHIKDSELDRGHSIKTAERIAAATVNKSKSKKSKKS